MRPATAMGKETPTDLRLSSLVVVVVVVYLHDITTYINIREISQMNHANKDLKEVKNL